MTVIESKNIRNVQQNPRKNNYFYLKGTDILYTPTTYQNILWEIANVSHNTPQKFEFLTNSNDPNNSYTNFNEFINISEKKTDGYEKLNVLSFNIGSERIDNLRKYVENILNYYCDNGSCLSSSVSSSVSSNEREQKIQKQTSPKNPTQDAPIKQNKSVLSKKPNASAFLSKKSRKVKKLTEGGEKRKRETVKKVRFDIIALQEVKVGIFDALNNNDTIETCSGRTENFVCDDDYGKTSIDKHRLVNTFDIVIKGITYFGIVAPRNQHGSSIRIEQAQLKYNLILIRKQILPDNYTIYYLPNKLKTLDPLYYLGIKLRSSLYINYHHQAVNNKITSNFKSFLVKMYNDYFKDNHNLNDIILSGDFNLTSSVIQKLITEINEKRANRKHIYANIYNRYTNTIGNSCPEAFGKTLNSNNKHKIEKALKEDKTIDNIIHFSKAEIEWPNEYKNPYWIFCNESDHSPVSAVVFIKNNGTMSAVEEFSDKKPLCNLYPPKKIRYFQDRNENKKYNTFSDSSDRYSNFVRNNNQFNEEMNQLSKVSKKSVITYNLGLSFNLKTEDTFFKHEDLSKIFQNIFDDYFKKVQSPSSNQKPSPSDQPKIGFTYLKDKKGFDIIHFQECPLVIVKSIYINDQTKKVDDNDIIKLNDAPTSKQSLDLNSMILDNTLWYNNGDLVKLDCITINGVEYTLICGICEGGGCNVMRFNITLFKRELTVNTFYHFVDKKDRTTWGIEIENNVYFNVHLSPEKINYFQHFIENIETKIVNYKNILISGDFNIEYNTIDKIMRQYKDIYYYIYNKSFPTKHQELLEFIKNAKLGKTEKIIDNILQIRKKPLSNGNNLSVKVTLKLEDHNSLAAIVEMS